MTQSDQKTEVFQYMPRVCGEIRSSEEKSLPSGRDLHEMGLQVVADAQAKKIMTFLLLL